MSLDEQTLRALFEKSQQSNADKMQFTPEESTRFQKSFEDPEFRKLFADYMDELSDPKNREETEAYISQLEGEQKVPEGKELIRPEPVFVAKSYKELKKDKTDKEKVFLNIVQSNKINTPSKTDTPKGTCWSVPYSLGPPHMEKDKNGDNAPCFDCCFHPEAIRLGMLHKEFKDLLVTTAMEGVEKLYQQQGQDVTIAREFHVVKGIDYKQGQVPTMMIAVASKENWNEKKGADKAKATKAVADNKPAPPLQVKETTAGAAPIPPKPPADANKTAAGPAIKKGFLSNSKGAIYGDKLTTIRPKKEPESAAKASSSGISLVDTPVASSLNNLNIPSAATAAKSKAGSNPGIQVVKKGDTVPAPAAAAPKMATRSSDAVAGMTAVSTTKRQPAPAPTPATPQLGSPSGSRDISVTSPSGSDVADSDLLARALAAEEAEAEGLAVPVYSMKERGHISMGDFENMNTTARSNRPNELVYRVELPKISKASLIVLDIAERQLNLSYPEVYSLSIKLPYPVFDTKGTAKYDKASKSLTITLPVRPPAAVPLSAPITPVRDSLVTEEPGADNKAESEGSSPTKGASPVKKSSAGHSRWVEKAPASTTPDAFSASTLTAGADATPVLSLKEEVQRQAEIALKQAQEAAAKAALETKKAPPAVAQKVAAPTPAAPVISTAATAVAPAAGQEFLASATFTGRKAGYVFKRGDLGQGYYLDARNPVRGAAAVPPTPTPAAVAAPAAPSLPSAAAAVTHKEFPFACRQTKQALAVIVEVPHIDKASVVVHFQAHSVSVSFRAFVDAPSAGGSGAGESSVSTVLYGAMLRLSPADCASGLNASACKFDVADNNMALVLTKAVPTYWHSSQASSKRPAEDATATGESKANDFASEEARALLEVSPFVAQVSVVHAVPASVVADTKSDVGSSLANAEVSKTLKSLESSIQSLQFSSSDALFELD